MDNTISVSSAWLVILLHTVKRRQFDYESAGEHQTSHTLNREEGFASISSIENLMKGGGSVVH